MRLSGGQHHTLSVPAPKPAWELRQTPPEIVAQIDGLLEQHTHAEIAEILNSQGHTIGENRPFHALMIRNIRDHYQLRHREQRLRDQGLLTLQEMATLLKISPITVKKWGCATRT